MEKTTTPTFSQDFFQIELLGGTKDLHAGQFVDRVGVALGLEFPAGPRLEQLALEAEASKLAIPSSVQGMSISFSGPESQAQRFIAEGKPPAEIARAVEKCIALSLEKLLLQALQNYGLREILFVGGVAANQYVRTRLSQKLEHSAVKAKLYFAEPVYSSDNAVGVALLGREYVLRSK
jgi:N6-L-threonylcarbamoyladenine synthase